MSDRRPTIEELGALAALAGDDARRRAAESDPLTAARLRAFEDFVAPGSLPEGADLADAEARLLVALERELGVPLAAPREQAKTRGAPRPGTGGGWSRFLARVAGPVWRPALAVAATLVVVAGAWTLLAPPGGDGPPLLRGPEAPLDAGSWDAAPTAEAAAPGTIRLAWRPAPGATRYAVVFLAPDLRELAQVDGLGGTELVLAATELPAGLASGQAVLWRVTAFHEGDEIGRSRTSTMVVP